MQNRKAEFQNDLEPLAAKTHKICLKVQIILESTK